MHPRGELANAARVSPLWVQIPLPLGTKGQASLCPITYLGIFEQVFMIYGKEVWESALDNKKGKRKNLSQPNR